MSSEEAAISAFLAAAGWGSASAAYLAGDASSRRYRRLRCPGSGSTAVLMISPQADTAPFVRLSRSLRSGGLSAPEVLATETSGRYLLLEDLGDATFTRSIAADPGSETRLYEAATDLLVVLQGLTPPDGVASLDAATLAEMTGMAFARYGGPITGTDAGPGILPHLADLFDRHLQGPAVLAHRDYHADNLIWLASRRGPARVGLLDFQDAVLTHPAYDLVSLLQDARRDLAPDIAARMKQRLQTALSMDPDRFDVAYAALGLQRNLRILGVFAALAADAGKPHYLSLLPRVHAHVMRNLDHPALAGLAGPLGAALPPPTSAVLDRLGRAA
ncbi:MAG: aminoglycoside phosphotransferase family protein [Marinibacterium sp.]